jgi:hypothetical protein
MWEGGIHSLSPHMGLPWLGKGMQFHITVDEVDTVNGRGGEFTTYPIVDPEIVVIASNPVGGVGIGIDPVASGAELAGVVRPGLAKTQMPCTGVKNPFDFSAWSKLPGFDHHHEGRYGTYVEDCKGRGGNICFALTPAIDPVPGVVDLFSLFDLVAHEFGHCLTIGHVGDGAEGPWGKVPTNDIMSYNTDPVGLNKCVSTLDVEGIATRMSNYLDVNNDHKVTAADRLLANDQPGDGRNAFQTQHPRDHWYASSTGAPTACPQPDLALLPGAPRTNWEPAPVATSDPVLTVTSPSEGASASSGAFTVTGSVDRVSRSSDPTAPTGFYDDADNDAKTPATEITALNVAVTPSTLESTLSVASLPPSGTTSTSPTAYSVTIDGRRFDSFMRYPVVDGGPVTWDAAAGAYMAAGTSTWDTAANSVSFHIPRSYLQAASITAPYQVSSNSNFGSLSTLVPDDFAPESGHTIGVSNARVISTPTPRAAPRSSMQTVTFQHPGGNTFFPEQSMLGVTSTVGLDNSHHFDLDVPQSSDVTFKLDWTDGVGGSDLDFNVSGAAVSADGASDRKPETATLTKVRGHLAISVEPYLVTDERGSTYTLTAVITPRQVVDTDGDGAPDESDLCPTVAGADPDGCPVKRYEHVHVYVDGVKAASQEVDTTNGAAAFSIPVTVSSGAHTLKVEWEYFGKVLATKTIHVSRP